MTCPTCGSQIPEGSVVCPVCSAQLGGGGVPGAMPYTGAVPGMAPPAVAPKSNNKIILIAVAAVALVAVVAVAAILLLSKPYEKPIKAFCKAIESGSLSDVVDTLPPVVQRVYEFAEDLTNEELDVNIAEKLEEDYGENIKVSYKIEDAEKLDDEDIDELEDDYQNYLILDMEIEEAYLLEVELSIEGDDDSDSETIDEFYVVKVDGEWYIDAGTLLNGELTNDIM